MKKTIESRVRALVCSTLLCEPDEVTETTNFRVDLDADSLDVIELAMEVEEHFDLSPIEEDEMPGTFSALCEMVRKKMREQQRKVEGDGEALHQEHGEREEVV